MKEILTLEEFRVAPHPESFYTKYIDSIRNYLSKLVIRLTSSMVDVNGKGHTSQHTYVAERITGEIIKGLGEDKGRRVSSTPDEEVNNSPRSLEDNLNPIPVLPQADGDDEKYWGNYY